MKFYRAYRHIQLRRNLLVAQVLRDVGEHFTLPPAQRKTRHSCAQARLDQFGGALCNSVEQLFARRYHQPEIQWHLLSRHAMDRQQTDRLFYRYPAILVSLDLETPRSGPLVNEHELFWRSCTTVA